MPKCPVFDRNLCLALLLLPILPCAAWAGGSLNVSFADVPPDHWAAQAVAAVSSHGIMVGYPEGEFTRPAAMAAVRGTKPVPASPGDWLILPGQRIGKIRLGETRRVDTIIGREGDARDSASGRCWERWYAPSPKPGAPKHELDVYTARTDDGRSEPVEQVWITSPAFHTMKGIRVGSTLAQIRRRFPHVRAVAYYDRQGIHQPIYVYDDARGGISFEVPRSPRGRGSESPCQAIGIHPRGKQVTDEYFQREGYTLLNR